MACQSGIEPNAELTNAIQAALAPKSSTRALKMIIKDEQLHLDGIDKIGNGFEKDYKKFIPACLKDDQPCFVLVRMDNPTGRQEPVNSFVLVSYTPDAAKTREKMLASSTRATLKHRVGVQHIVDELAANTKGECSYEAYKEHSDSKQRPGPMSEVEEGLYKVHMEERLTQQKAAVQHSLAAHTIRGVGFPIDANAIQALNALNTGDNNYVQLSVDILNEAIKLESVSSVSPDSLQACIPHNAARYHFYRYHHSHEGQQQSAIVFIYSIPTSGASIKEKMCYSSCKRPFLDDVARLCNIVPDKKVEIDSKDEINEKFLIDELHPPAHVPQQQLFSKPKPPGGSSRRMIKTSN